MYACSLEVGLRVPSFAALVWLVVLLFRLKHAKLSCQRRGHNIIDYLPPVEQISSPFCLKMGFLVDV